MIILPLVYAESSLEATHGSQLQRLDDMLSGWVRVHDGPTWAVRLTTPSVVKTGRTNTVPSFYSKDSAN